MKIFLLPTTYGIFALNDSNQLVDKVYFQSPLNDLAGVYVQSQKGEINESLKEMLQRMKSQQINEFLVEDPALISPISQFIGISCSLFDDYPRLKRIKDNYLELLAGQIPNLNASKLLTDTRILSEFMIKLQIAEISTHHDLHIKQSVDTISDLNKSINLLATRLREWYGLHYPELTDKLIDDNIKFAIFVAKLGMRENFTKERLVTEFELSEEKAELIAGKALRSMGGLLTEKDVETIQVLAKYVLDLVNLREKIDQYLSDILQEVAPNLKHVLGVPVASQLIALAGNLEKLAQFPSSTIQVLGAEKALFKALKYGIKTPKHGIIFQWHKIRSEKSYLRGKISRMVAGKISILAKVDFYKGEFIGEKISHDLETKIELIKKTFPNAPPPKSASTTSETPQRRFNNSSRKPDHQDRNQFSRKQKDRGKKGDGSQFHKKKFKGNRGA
jgi:nucleolar protein 56